ncbi:MAG: hypothetical protein DYG89_40015 [Caldilinea sp. CFX5]|nr:hypothetical protein [Caldilinea sp. CFX5]
MVRRRVVTISAVAILGLALIGALLTVMNSQPAFAKTAPTGAMRQTGTDDATDMTDAMMSHSEMEATGQSMMHLLLALHAIHQMQKDQMNNPSMMMGEMGSTTATTGTTGTGDMMAGMGAMSAGAQVGGLLEVMGHLAESMGYMHDAMAGTAMMDSSAMAATDDAMSSDWADVRTMLDIVDQMVQATADQVGGATDATDTTASTDITGTMMSGSLATAALLPDMVQTLQAMSIQLRMSLDAMNGMTGATDTGSTATTTDTTGTMTDTTDSDMMGMGMMGMPDLRQSMQAMGMALELMGNIHKMAAMNSMMGAGMTGDTTGDMSEMTGLVSDLAQAMSDHLDNMMGMMDDAMMGSDTGATATGSTATTTDTAGADTGTAITDTADITDTTGATDMTGSDMMGMGNANDVLTSSAQLMQTILQQIQAMSGGTSQ